MPSTRNQKAREKRSREVDAMSELENVDVMLGSFSKTEVRCEHNVMSIWN